MDRFQADKDRLPPERRDLILNYFPKFLADMEMELGNDASPVWDPTYIHRPPSYIENIKGIAIFNTYLTNSIVFDRYFYVLVEEGVAQPNEASFQRLTTSGLVRGPPKDLDR